MRRFLPRLLCLLLLLAAPLARAQREFLTPDQIDYVEKTWPGVKKTNTGMRFRIEKEGSGESPKAGEKVSVLYVGTLLQGAEFDRTKDPEKPFEFRVDRGQVIDGWDQIIKMMKVGEKRVVIIPPALAYGSRGQGSRIPRDSVLVFEMELVAINRG